MSKYAARCPRSLALGDLGKHTLPSGDPELSEGIPCPYKRIQPRLLRFIEKLRPGTETPAHGGPDADAAGAVYSLIMSAMETEIKFAVADLAALAERLAAAGFGVQTARAFESNTLYDTPGRDLRAHTEILRIRHYAGRTVLTHKRVPETGPGAGQSDGLQAATADRHKHRIETETEVSDGEALEQVFRSLGLLPAFRYEKWRTEWSDGEGHCVVDETPIGNYAELEGKAEWIDRAAARLGIAPSDYSTLSYGRLFEEWKLQTGSTAEGLTFAECGKAVDAAV